MNKNIEKELKQVRGCLKDKDERIGVLETSLEYLGKKREDVIRWFNVICVIVFVIAIAILIGVSHYFYPDLLSGLAGHVAILGTFAIVSNFLICVCGTIIFEKDDDDVGMFLFIYNIFVVPFCVVIYAVFVMVLTGFGS